MNNPKSRTILIIDFILLIHLNTTLATCMIQIEEIMKRLNLLEDVGNKFELSYHLLDKPNPHVGQIINEVWTKALNIPNACLVVPKLPYDITQITDGNIISEAESSKLFNSMELGDRQIKQKLCADKNTTVCQEALDNSSVSESNASENILQHMLHSSISNIEHSNEPITDTSPSMESFEIPELNINCKSMNIKEKSTLFEAINCVLSTQQPSSSTDVDVSISNLRITII